MRPALFPPFPIHRANWPSRTAARGDRDPRGSVIATSFDFLLVLDAINTSGISLFQTERRKKKKKRERKKRKIIHAPRFEQFASLNVPRIFLFSLSFFLPTDIHSSRDSTSLFNVSMNGLVIHSSRRRSSLSIHSSSSSSSFVTSFEIRSACAQKSKTYRNEYPPFSS